MISISSIENWEREKMCTPASDKLRSLEDTPCQEGHQLQSTSSC